MTALLIILGLFVVVASFLVGTATVHAYGDLKEDAAYKTDCESCDDCKCGEQK